MKQAYRVGVAAWCGLHGRGEGHGGVDGVADEVMSHGRGEGHGGEGGLADESW